MNRFFTVILSLLTAMALLTGCADLAGNDPIVSADTPSTAATKEPQPGTETPETTAAEPEETEAPEMTAPETTAAETEPEDLDDEELRYDVISVDLVCGSYSETLKNSEINTILDAFSKFDYVEGDAYELPPISGPLPNLRITAEEGVRNLEILFSESGFVLFVYPLNEPHTIDGRINLKNYDLYDQFEAFDDETRETILSYIDRAYDLLPYGYDYDEGKWRVPESSSNNNSDSNIGGLPKWVQN